MLGRSSASVRASERCGICTESSEGVVRRATFSV